MSALPQILPRLASRHIFGVRDRLNVAWIHAATNSTEVIQSQSIRHSANQMLVCVPVGAHHALAIPKLRVAVPICAGGPDPASRLVNLKLASENIPTIHPGLQSVCFGAQG
jgi:hypothetical protein